MCIRDSSPNCAPLNCVFVIVLLCCRQVIHLTNEMLSIYSTAVVTDSQGRDHRLDPELTDIMSTSRDYDQLEWAWQGWRNATGPMIKPLYSQLVEKMNQAAIDNGNYGNHTCKRYYNHQRHF